MGSGETCACERCVAKARAAGELAGDAAPASATQLAEAIANLAAAQFARAAGRDGGREAGMPAIGGAMLSGFEPFRHPELVSVIDRVRAAGITRIGVQTSGVALALPANAAGSIGAGVRVFEFVLLGAGVHHDVACGTPGAFDAAIAGIRQVRESARAAGVRIFPAALVRLCPHNRGQLVAAVGAAVAAGVRAVRIQVDAGAIPEPGEVRAAHEIATTAGVALFGDGAEHLLNGATLYRSVALETLVAPAASEASVGTGGGAHVG